MIAELLADALEAKGFPREAVSMIESTDARPLASS